MYSAQYGSGNVVEKQNRDKNKNSFINEAFHRFLNILIKSLFFQLSLHLRIIVAYKMLYNYTGNHTVKTNLTIIKLHREKLQLFGCYTTLVNILSCGTTTL